MRPADAESAEAGAASMRGRHRCSRWQRRCERSEWPERHGQPPARAARCPAGWRRPLVALTLAAVSAAAATAADTEGAPPPNGRYAATLCVSTSAQPARCGPAALDVRPGGRLRVQVSDIVYRLDVGAGEAAVVVTQGAMQLDEFITSAAWAGGALRFADDEKHVRYEVRVGRPEPASR